MVIFAGSWSFWTAKFGLGQGHQGHSQGQNKTLAHVGKRLT